MATRETEPGTLGDLSEHCCRPSPGPRHSDYSKQPNLSPNEYDWVAEGPAECVTQLTNGGVFCWQRTLWGVVDQVTGFCIGLILHLFRGLVGVGPGMQLQGGNFRFDIRMVYFFILLGPPRDRIGSRKLATPLYYDR